MATNNWTSTYESEPAAGDNISGGDDEIRDTKEDVRTRLNHEHVMTGFESGSGAPALDGWHKEGSAMVYYGTSEPTTRPDGSTALDSDDEGRTWVDTSNSLLKVYSGSAWVNVPGIVFTSGDQTLAGVKTFSDFIDNDAGINPAGSYSANTATENNIFDALSGVIATGESILISGALTYVGSYIGADYYGTYTYNKAYRSSATIIQLSYTRLGYTQAAGWAASKGVHDMEDGNSDVPGTVLGGLTSQSISISW